jgi:pentatricopeptide repeat protein
MEPGAASRGDSLLASMMEQYQRDPLKNADLRPNTHVFNTVINCWAKSLEQDAADKAEEMLVAMERMAIPGVKPDAFTYTAVIDSWAKSGYRGAAMRASELLERMESRYRAGDLALKPNNFTYNAVINSLAKSKEPGAAEKAERVLQNMVNRYKSGGENDVKPTTINFNTVLDAWAKSGGGRSSAERAERILQWMDEIHRSGNDDAKPGKYLRRSFVKIFVHQGLFFITVFPKIQ